MSKRIVKVAQPMVGEEEIQAAAEVLRSGWYTSGPRVKEFERAFADYIGTKEAAMVSSGTAALYISLAVLGIRPGDQVIVPALTFFSTVTAVLHERAVPVFADIDPDTYCLDPDSVAEKITNKTRAIIPVHLYGHPANMDGLMDVTEDRDIFIIEDAAQAHGAEYRGKKCGSLGDIGCWSFFATKNMTTAVEGGAITTDNKAMAAMARIIRSHGMTTRNEHSLLGYNDRMDEVGAAIGLVQLRKLDLMNEIRTKYTEYLRKKLTGISWLKIPPVKPWAKHAWFWCPVEVDEEKLGVSTLYLCKKLKYLGVETRHRYTTPLYNQPVLRNYRHIHNYKSDYCPNAERIVGKMLGLPNHPGLTCEDLDYVIETVKSI